MLDFAGLERTSKMSGLSLRPLVGGEAALKWRDEVVVENNMTQAGVVGDSVPMTDGRMLRGERYKYCVYSFGEHRESLVDLQNDPGETIDLARDPKYRDVLLQCREHLRKFGVEHHDPEVARMLANDVPARPFPQVAAPKKERPNKKAAAKKTGE